MKSKLTLIVAIAITLNFGAFAQNYLPFSLKLGIGTVSNEPVFIPGMSYQFPVGSKPLFRAEFDYKISNKFETGVYAAYSNPARVEELNYTRNDNGQVISVSVVNAPKDVFFYGVKASYLPLPDLLRSNKMLRFNPYIGFTIGGVSASWNDRITDLKVTENPFFEYGAILGTDFKISRSFGIYAEYSIGQFYHNSNQRLHGGIKFDF
jgi:hypothetical protein